MYVLLFFALSPEWSIKKSKEESRLFLEKKHCWSCPQAVLFFFSVGSFYKEQENVFFHGAVAFDLSGQANNGWRADDKSVVEQTDLNFFWSLWSLVVGDLLVFIKPGSLSIFGNNKT